MSKGKIIFIAIIVMLASLFAAFAIIAWRGISNDAILPMTSVLVRDLNHYNRMARERGVATIDTLADVLNKYCPDTRSLIMADCRYEEPSADSPDWRPWEFFYINRFNDLSRFLIPPGEYTQGEWAVDVVYIRDSWRLFGR